jgi:hypothetical protein
VHAPLFHEVLLNAPIDVISRRLRSFGRTFPERLEIVQVAHVLKKRGKFYICHFKSLLYLDGVAERNDITLRDLAETYAAVMMLLRDGLVTIETDFDVEQFGPVPPHVKDVSRDTYYDWKRVSKYTFKPSPNR